ADSQTDTRSDSATGTAHADRAGVRRGTAAAHPGNRRNRAPLAASRKSPSTVACARCRFRARESGACPLSPGRCRAACYRRQAGIRSRARCREASSVELEVAVAFAHLEGQIERACHLSRTFADAFDHLIEAIANLALVLAQPFEFALETVAHVDPDVRVLRGGHEHFTDFVWLEYFEQQLRDNVR